VKKFVFLILLSGFLWAFNLHAQELTPDQTTISKAQVLKVLSQSSQLIPGTNTSQNLQSIEVKILEGPEKEKIVVVENDYLQLKVGDVFYLTKTVRADGGADVYSVSDPYRLNSIYFFAALFILLVLLIGGWQGLRGLLSLAGGLLVIFYLFIPGVNQGFSPILMSIGVASLIVILGSYITHGFNKTTTAAVIGMIGTVVFTGLLAYIAVKTSHLSGFESEEAVYLNFNARGHIDLQGLLLGGILIGVLGVLYDVSIGQAISVEELHRVGPHLSRRFIYKRALRIGREHIGALVNTLAIAYIGVSLPLILFYFTTTTPVPIIINSGIFATEIIRTLIGSIGLVLAVPITTLISILLLIKTKPISKDDPLYQKEKEEAEQLSGHAHHHHH
jgi:uncharacterized membrane protein